MRDWVRNSYSETVVVHTKDNSSIRGVLYHATKRELILVRASYLTDGLPKELKGEIGIPRENVSFIQRLTREEQV